MGTPWSHRFAQRTRTIKSSAIRELLKLTQLPEVISFAAGLPAPEVFPVERFQHACLKVLDDNGPASLQYSTTEGYLPLRDMVANHLQRYGILATVDNVMITSGSQQALDLIAKLLINRGDRLLVEAPTYLGALQTFNVFGAEYVSVPTDQDGLRTDLLEEALRSGPKFMYILPNFQNPSGVTLSLEHREELVFLADKYGIPLIEDDPYGQLRYEGDHIVPLVVLDRVNLRRDSGYTLGNVIYLSTFSKTLAPGIRLGWIVAPAEVISKLVQLKRGADLHTSTFNQMVAYEVARDNFLDDHIKTMRRVYGERRDVMLHALNEYFPPEVTWTRPHGGLFLWVTMPEGTNSNVMLESAVQEKVAFVPGDCFYPGEGDGLNNMRLNFSNATPEQIREGIRRLATVVRTHIDQYAPVTVMASIPAGLAPPPGMTMCRLRPNEALDFPGLVDLQAKLSEMTTGARSCFAKLAQPFFEENKGTGNIEVPIKISGTRKEPKFGPDVGKVLNKH